MTDETPPAIDCRNIFKRFGHDASLALDDVSLAIRPGEFFTLLGPSGCGKTTLLRVIGGFERQDSGSVRLNGEAIDDLPPHRRRVNTVFQSYAVFPHMSVAANVAFGLQMQRRSRAEIATRVAEMVALVRLGGLERRRPDALSGGQQQRVALARALAARPAALLLDEPLSALDLKLRTEMQMELKRLQSEVGITFVFVTHDQTEALALSDRIAVMRAGKVVQVGAPRDIYERPASRFVAEFVGESNVLEAESLGGARFRLGCGAVIEASKTSAAGTRTTLTIRPERARLVATGRGVPAIVEQIVYLGTDTMHHLRFADGAPFRVRDQNRGSAPLTPPGGAVAVLLPPEALRVLPG